MRTPLLPGLVAALARNVARQQPRVRLFELGKVFARGRQASAPLRDPARRRRRLRRRRRRAVGRRPRAGRLPRPQGRPRSLAALSGAHARLSGRRSAACGHPGRSADVVRVDGRRGALGWIGQLHPRLQRALDLDADVVAFELDLAPLLARAIAARARRCRSTRPSAATSRSSSPKRCRWADRCGQRASRRGRVPARSGAVRPLRRQGGRNRIQESRYGLDSAG